MRPAAFWSLLRRESRGQRGRLVFLMTCLAVGVCAVVAVSAMVAALRAGTAERSRELLGADLQVKSRQPLPAELDRLVADLEGAERSDLVELPTMVAAPTGAARLVQIVAVSGRWPLFGRLGCEPADAPLFLGRGVAVEAAGLRDLGLEVGDEILVGGRPFPIVARVLEAPEKSGFAFMLGPRIFMGRGALDETGLLAFGSRLEYKALIRLGATDASRARDLAERWRDALPGAEYLDIRSHDAAEERIARPIEQAESYLGLVALLSLVLGGIGVARIVQTWIESRQRGIAVMRCLGMRPIEVALVYLGQIMLLALLASLVGAAIGLCAPAVLRVLLADFLPGGDLPVWQPVALVDGLLLGLAMALLFSVPALAALWRVSPARAFRTGAEPLPAPRFLGLACWATVALGLWVAAWRRSGSGSLALAFVFLLGLATALLALAAWVLRRVLALLPRDRLPLALRHGLAALLRPASGLRAALVAIGLGSLVVSTIFLVQDRLAQGIAQAIPAAAPTAFFVDVQPDQWPRLRQELEDRDAGAVDSVPVVMARLVAIDGRSVREIAAERQLRAGDSVENRRGWVLTREQRITWLESFDDSNRLVEGRPFGADPGPEISIERRFARDLGVGLGSRLRFDLQGIPIDFTVTSIREVEWASFRINFFLVAEPGSLEGAPYFRIATARLEPGQEDELERAVAADLPNVSMIRVRSILAKVVGILEGLLAGIAALGSFSVVAGLGILAGAVSSSSLRRRREAALLKVLGLGPRGVLLNFLVEFGLLGLVAGGLGALGGLGLSLAFAARFELEGATRPLLLLWIVGAVTILTMVAGSLAAGRSLRARPRLALGGD